MSAALDRVTQVKRVGEEGSNPTPTFQGLISTKLGQRFSLNSLAETYVLDTGSCIPVIPQVVANEHKLYIKTKVGNEARLTYTSGNDMEIVGETTFYVKFTCFSTPRRVTGPF